LFEKLCHKFLFIINLTATGDFVLKMQKKFKDKNLFRNIKRLKFNLITSIPYQKTLFSYLFIQDFNKAILTYFGWSLINGL